MAVEKPVVLVLMPGCLHLARLAVARIPATRPVILVLNGLDRWEARWATRNLGANHWIRFSSPRRHSDVINLLIDRLRGNFYLMDYDCFVLDEKWFERLASVESDRMMSGCFPYTVDGTGLELGHTFLLYLNRGVLKDLKDRFGIGAEEATWDQLPEPARQRIRASGLVEGRYPEPDRPYFDTLRALSLVGMGEGRSCAIVGRFSGHPEPNKEMIHVGGVSPRAEIFNVWLYRGAYFWRKALRNLPDKELSERYRRKFGDVDPGALAAAHPQFAASLGEELDAVFDGIIRDQTPAGPQRRRPPLGGHTAVTVESESN